MVKLCEINHNMEVIIHATRHVLSLTKDSDLSWLASGTAKEVFSHARIVSSIKGSSRVNGQCTCRYRIEL